MRVRGAPESRGRYRTLVFGLAGRIGLPVFVFLAALAGAIDRNATAADPPAVRQLQPISSDPKPAFALPDLDGATRSLDQSAGKITLVHFFATWCEPCREELASLSGLVEKQPAAGRITVLAVNVAEVPARVRRFLESAPVKFPVLLDGDRAVTRAWGISVLPTTVVLDRALVPRRLVEGDIDWLRDDVLATLEQIALSNSQ